MIISRAPLRVTFVGGGTDYPEFFNENLGCVVGSSIDKYVYFNLLTLPRFAEQNFRFTYRVTESVLNHEEISHPVIREILISRNSKQSLNMSTMADIPGNSGLGSSSSFTVAALKAFAEFDKLGSDADFLAQSAIKIERDQLKESGGWQDQYQAAFGGLRSYEFRVNSVEVSGPLILDSLYEELGKNFFLVKAGNPRGSSVNASKIINSIREKTILKELQELTDLAQACKSQLLKSGHDPISLIEILANYTKLGWEIKKGYNPNGVPIQVDDLIKHGLRNGASAGKLCGAGESGYVLFIVPTSRSSAFQKAFPNEDFVEVKLSQKGAETIYSQTISGRSRNEEQ